jgi:A/G-specific adenine glycosylase
MVPSEPPSVPRSRRAALNRALLGWFARHGRSLAFRATQDPYAVLVAEVMLQQTQASRVEPAWRSFMARFPTVGDLAAASPAEVIRSWAGLGYNQRAVRLRGAAQVVVERHGGRLPRDPALLARLPGVGPYTARAVAATAFDRPVAAVDTNVRRVVGRVFGLEPLAGRGAAGRGAGAGGAARQVQGLADAWISRRRAAAWTHALMDVGATLCRLRDPLCSECPLQRLCLHATASAATEIAGKAPPRGARGPTRPVVPFPATRRWLRGRLVARLREQSDGRWVELSGPLGGHSAEAVGDALGRLVREGLVERDGRGRVRLPAGPT